MKIRNSVFLACALASGAASAGTLTIDGTLFGAITNEPGTTSRVTSHYGDVFVRQRIAVGQLGGAAQIHAEFEGASWGTPFVNLQFSTNASPGWLTIQDIGQWICNPNCAYVDEGTGFPNSVTSPIALGGGYNANGGSINAFKQSYTNGKWIYDFAANFGATSTLYMFVETINGQLLNDYTFTITGSGIADNLIQVQPVPVPAAAWLMGSGLLGLAGLSRRRKVH